MLIALERRSGGVAQPPRNLQTISGARALGGEVCGREVSAPGPGHSVKDRSLSVRPSPDAPDGLLIHSFAGDGWQYCRDHVRERLGFAPFRPERARAHRIRRKPPLAPQDRAQHHKLVLRIWCETGDPRGRGLAVENGGRAETNSQSGARDTRQGFRPGG
jgi:hypothetical protein